MYDLEMSVRLREQSLALVNSEEIDLAVVVREPKAPNLVAHQVATHPFALVASAAHALVTSPLF